MQKYFYGLIALLILMLLPAEAFIDRRIAWWSLRLEEIEGKTEAIKKQKYGFSDPNLIDLYQKDAKRCKETIEILKKNIPQEQHRYTIESMQARINQLLMPVYSLRLLELITEHAGKESARTEARNFFSTTIKNLFETKSTQGNAIKQEKFIPTLTNDELDVLAIELIVGTFMDSFDPLYKKLATSIEQDIMSHSKQQGDSFEIENLNALIQEKAMEKCGELNFPDEMLSALQKSGTWKLIFRKLLQSAIFINDVHRYLEDADAMSHAHDATYYLKNLSSLDKIIFDAETERTISHIREKFNRLYENEEYTSISLPTPEKIFKSIDNCRRKILANIAGNEAKEFFEKANDSLVEVITHIIRPSEKLIESCKKNECAASTEIESATKKLSILKEYSLKYSEKSLSFLEWAAKTRSIDQKLLLEDYNYFTERLISYMNFIRSLTEKSASTAFFESAELQLKFVVAAKKNQKVLTILQNIPIHEKSLFPSLNASTIAALKKYKSLLTENANRTQRDINTALTAYQSRIEEYAKKRQNKNIKLEAGIAQYDMDQLVSTLKDYTSYYSSLIYSENALKRYADAYKAIEIPKDDSEAETRNLALRHGTLIPFIDGFEINKLKNEYRTKAFLKKEIRALMAKIHATGVFYRQNGFSVSSLFSVDDAAKISEMLEKQSGVVVGDWTMNEGNVEEVDKKAIKKLLHTSQKQEWKLSTNGSYISSDKTTVVLEREGIRFSIPGIWIEEGIDEHLAQRKIVKAFRSRDGSSSIVIASSLLDGNPTLIDHATLWHTTLGSKIVKSGVKRIGTNEYYWTLARDEKNRVRESFTVKITPHEALIISGQSPKERYNFFHKKMEMLLTTLERIGSSQKMQ
ncbi:MAG: hypothetical protein N2316_05900 [Spirochaetes bacterium]|nr:hypothetical protein [Spirochaetota bacterium]